MRSGVNLSGDLPSGGAFRAWVAVDEIALRVGERICVAHRQWMTSAEARRVADALLRLADESDPALPVDSKAKETPNG